jgi:hypothetical protein
MDQMPDYPDISDILARKAKGREAASKKSFAEKIAIVEALNARLAPLKAARERRRERLRQIGPDAPKTNA